LDFELKSLRERSRQVRLQIELAEEVLKKSQELYQKGAVPGAQLLKEKSQLSILRSQLAEQESEYESRSTEGTRLAQAELARRQQQLAEASSQLRLIQLGTRPEEIEAEEARARRLQEEHAFLLKQKEKLVVKATAEGIVSAPRFGERVGQFVPQGGLLCRIEDPGVPNIEIFVSEDDAATIFPGQRVELKARSIPFETFQGVVDRVAPDAAKPRDAVASQQSFVRQSVVVHCRIQEAEDKLKAGMTGTGRIYRDEKSVGAILASKIYKYVRTEFWW
jgi:HlyD family secretion protein